MKHTPAPWKFVIDEKDDDDMGSIVGDGDVRICYFGNGSTYHPNEGSDPNNDNLNLILAAPELLEALQDILNSALANQAAINQPLIDNARVAIKKATGE